MIELYNKVKLLPVLSSSDEIELVSLAQNGCEVSKESFVLHNMKLVFKASQRYQGQGIDNDDLVSYATCGLLTAIDKFDTTLGYKFSTYASFWIKDSLTKALNQFSRGIRITKDYYAKIYLLKNLTKEYVKAHSQEPTVSQLAELANMKEDEVMKAREVAKSTLSLNEKGKAGDEAREAVEYLVSDEACPVSSLELKEKTKDIMEALDGLSEREKDFIITRYGILNHEPKTLVETGREYGVGRDRARQIIMAGLKKLKHSKATREFT